MNLSKNPIYLPTYFHTEHCRLKKHLLRKGVLDTNKFKFSGEKELMHYLSESAFDLLAEGRSALGKKLKGMAC